MGTQQKNQHAYDCYIHHFGESENHVNVDIAIAKNNVPPHDLLVGGFPCQDYSVAQTGAKGIEGKKGVLWWEIRDIIHEHKPSYILLENVDRLIKSPSKQRGRDFAIILRCLYELGYGVEWRVINAADYGYAQRRRRIFIFAYKNSTKICKNLITEFAHNGDKILPELLKTSGFYAKPFPVKNEKNTNKQTFVSINELKYENLQEVSDNFTASFYNGGIMINGDIYSEELTPIENKPITLREIRHTEEVNKSYFLNGSTEKWTYLKGAKKIDRIKPNGEPYVFSEGTMCFQMI